MAKYTEQGGGEYETVRTASERTRQILESIDKQVRKTKLTLSG